MFTVLYFQHARQSLVYLEKKIKVLPFFQFFLDGISGREKIVHALNILPDEISTL